MRTTERIYQTSDMRYVLGENNSEAAYLAYAEGDEIPDDLVISGTAQVVVEEEKPPRRNVTRGRKPNGAR